jgi:hypothetical protein
MPLRRWISQAGSRLPCMYMLRRVVSFYILNENLTLLITTLSRHSYISFLETSSSLVLNHKYG